MTARGETRSTFAAHVRVVALLLAGDDRSAAQALADCDVDAFARFVDHNKLQFHIAALAPDSPLRSALPAVQLAAIDAYAAEQRERQGALAGELDALSDILESAGIDFMLLKGLYFADRFCGGVANRFSWDLDVMVRQGDAARVDRILRRGGYFRRSAVLGSRALTSRFVHAFDYGNLRPRFSVDLHWMFSMHPSFAVDYTAVWAARESYVLLGRRFAVLSLENEIVSNTLSAFRDIQRGAIRMRSLVDIRRVLEAADGTLAWDALVERCRRERVAGIVVNVLDVLLGVLDCRERFPGAARAAEQSRDLIVSPPQGDVATLFVPDAGALAGRRWTATIYDCSRLEVAGWWLMSLPFRMAVYKSGRRYAILKRRIHAIRLRVRERSRVRTRPVPRELP